MFGMWRVSMHDRMVDCARVWVQHTAWQKPGTIRCKTKWLQAARRVSGEGILPVFAAHC
jgi:hypothetical protein